MASMRSFCPYCHSIIPAGQRCSCRKTKRQPTKGDTTRAEREPWRSNYNQADYQRNRQAAIERTNGRCTDCNRVCAIKRNGRWYTAELGGEVDHLRALEEGGSNDASNLELRCKSCHGKRDAERRRSKKSK